MKAILKFIIASLLAFEPALATQGAADLQNDFRRFVELSGMSQKSVSLQELYDKFGSFLPAEERARIKPFIENFGQMKLPKMDLAKFKTPSGVMAYKLTYAQKGRSGAIEFYGDPQTVYKINGKAFTPEMAGAAVGVLAAADLPKNISENLFPIKQANSGYLSAQEIAQLSKSDQKKYFKEFQELIISLEAVQNFSKIEKTASLNIFEKYPHFAILFQSEFSWAMKVGESCIIGGNVSSVAFEKGGRLKCGTKPGGIGPVDDIKGSCTGKNQVQCNKALFGPNAECADAGPSTTAECARKVEGKDIPDFANSQGSDQLGQFNRLKEEALNKANELGSVCEGIMKLSATGKVAGIVQDQQATCKKFFERKAVIDSWDCGKNSDFKSKYTKLCEDRKPPGSGSPAPGGTPAPGGADQTPGGGAGAGAGAGGGKPPENKPPGIASCQEQGYQIAEGESGVTCKTGTPKKADKGTQCKQGDTLITDTNKIWYCICSDLKTKVDKEGKCGGTAAATNPGGDKTWWDSTKAWFSKNSKWLVPLGFGIAGLMLFHWMAKQQAKQYYNYLNPTPANPPVAPNPTAPVPRGSQ